MRPLLGSFRWFPPGNYPLRYWLFSRPRVNDSDTYFWMRIVGLEITIVK